MVDFIDIVYAVTLSPDTTAAAITGTVRFRTDTSCAIICTLSADSHELIDTHLLRLPAGDSVHTLPEVRIVRKDAPFDTKPTDYLMTFRYGASGNELAENESSLRIGGANTEKS